MFGMPRTQDVSPSVSMPGGGPPPPPPPPMGAMTRRIAPPSVEKAISAQQGAGYTKFSSYGLALQRSGIAHFNDVPDLPKARREQFMETWRKLAVDMRLRKEDIDDTAESMVRGKLNAMADEWHTYRRGSASQVFRGDKPIIRETYPWLDSFIRDTEGRPHAITRPPPTSARDLIIRAPTVMSTSQEHSNVYAQRAEVLWHLALNSAHPGVAEGIYTAEREITLPMYARIRIESLHYVPPGSSYLLNRAYGTAHRYVIKGSVLPDPVVARRRGSWSGYVNQVRRLVGNWVF